MPLNRREFIIGAGYLAAGLIIGYIGIEKGGTYLTAPPLDKLAADATIIDKLRDPEYLNELKDKLASRFISSTKPLISDKQILTRDWTWLITENDEIKYRKDNRIPDIIDVFWGITSITDKPERPTTINVNAINKLRHQYNTRTDINPDIVIHRILEQVILHEMERKIQPVVKYPFPKKLRIYKNPDTIFSFVGSTCGFDMVTPISSMIEDGDDGQIKIRSVPEAQLVPFMDLDMMGAEAAASIAQGENYFSEYTVGRKWTNLRRFLNLPEIGLSPEQFVGYHRQSDPFGLGTFISERLNFRSSSIYEQVRIEHESSLGLVALGLAMDGPGQAFDKFKSDLGLSINFN